MREKKIVVWSVVTEQGTEVYEGSKVDCNRYLRQALMKGSPVGFLRIVKQIERRN